MSMHINLLIVLLLCTGLLIPIFYVVTYRLPAWSSNSTIEITIRYWLYFLFSIFGLRVLVGFLLLFTGLTLSGIAKFYPIRIAYPNYDLLYGIPYVFLCLMIFFNLERIKNYIFYNRSKYFFLWLLSVIFLISFGSIHGGLVPGNAWMASAQEHLSDASINHTISEVFPHMSNVFLVL